MRDYRKNKMAVWLLAFFTLAALFIHIGIIYYTNHMQYTVQGKDESRPTYMDIDFRGDATSSWLKRDYNLYGETVDLTGTTIDETLYNNANMEVNGWTLRINILGDCFINQAWDGEMEIHQFVGTEKEKVQRLSLQDYKLEEVQLEKLYDGDLLIPLQKGDYLIYYPNAAYDETVIAKNDKVRVGVIFYYLDEIDLSDYQLDYYYYKAFYQGVSFYIFILLLVALFTAVVALVATIVTFKATATHIELQKSSISCMSGIYSIIYMIHLSKDELEIVSADEHSEKMRPKHLGAREQLQNLFEWDSEDNYKKVMLEFVDTHTLAERLKDRNNIAIEYVSKHSGWCRIRFFVMDQDKAGAVEKVLFTIQRIADEKKEIEDIQDLVTKAESENKAKSVFLANMSHEIRTPINAVLGFNTMILRKSADPIIRGYAKEIKSAGNMLLSLINGILDFSKLEAEKMELTPAEYSIGLLLADVCNMTKKRMEAKNLEFKVDIAKNIPARLYGDDLRIRQVLINLLTNAAKYTEAGEVALSIYGKVTGPNVHLLVSVKDTGMGIKEEDREKLTQRFARLDEDKNRMVEGTGIGLSLVCGLLKLMGSELCVISTYGEGSEFYFELDQEIIDPEPIGDFNIDAMYNQEDEDTGNTLRVQNTHVLVVDDNATNLLVFEELLSDSGIKIEKANSGMEALKLTLDRAFDIIFMDHMMPGMDGIECFDRIKQQSYGKNKNTPVVMLTANALSGAKEEYEKEGFAGFLAKPVQMSELENMLIKLLPDDRILEHKAEETIGEAAKEETLPAIEGVDTNYAIQHIGSVNGVIKVWQQFMSFYKEDEKELRSYYSQIQENAKNSEALNSYRIKVHAMKTSANLLGSLSTYGMALSLEKAARSEKVSQIMDMTDYFLTEWHELGKAVEQALGAAGKDGASISRVDLDTLCKQLKTSMNAYDVKSADALIEEMSGYDFSETNADTFQELKVAVSQLDAEKTEALCDKIMASE